MGEFRPEDGRRDSDHGGWRRESHVIDPPAGYKDSARQVRIMGIEVHPTLLS